MSRRSAIEEEDNGYEHPSGQIHTCVICGAQGVWKKPWSWFGSWKDWDDGKPILKFCSQACAGRREEYETKRRIAASIEAAKTEEQRLEDELTRKRQWREQMEAQIAATKDSQVNP